MPFIQPHHYLTLSGTLHDVEEWSFGLRLRDVAPSAVEQDQAALNAFAPLVRAHWSSQGNPISSASRLTTLKYNAVDQLGHYVNQTTVAAEVVPSVSGAGGQATFPPQVALVVTLETGFSRGLAHRGRIYLPSPTGVLSQVTGALESTWSQLAATWAAGLIDLINGHPGFGTVMVASSGSTKPGAPDTGAERLVTGVSCGSVLDTMRSRRSSMREARATADLGN